MNYYLLSNKITKRQNLSNFHSLDALELGANRIKNTENLGHLTGLKEL